MGLPPPPWLAGRFISSIRRRRFRSCRAPRFTPAQFAALLAEVEKGTISANAAKEVFGEMFRTGKEAGAVLAEKGLGQVQDAGAGERGTRPW